MLTGIFSMEPLSHVLGVKKLRLCKVVSAYDDLVCIAGTMKQGGV